MFFVEVVFICKYFKNKISYILVHRKKPLLSPFFPPFKGKQSLLLPESEFQKDSYFNHFRFCIWLGLEGGGWLFCCLHAKLQLSLYYKWERSSAADSLRDHAYACVQVYVCCYMSGMVIGSCVWQKYSSIAHSKKWNLSVVEVSVITSRKK